MPKCRECGKTINRNEADICPFCGCPNPIPANYETMDVTKTILRLKDEDINLYRSKSAKTYYLLCLCLGFVGAHNFYIEKTGLAFFDIFITLAITLGVGFLLFFLTPLSAFGFLIGFGLSVLTFAIVSLFLRLKDSPKDGNGEYLR